MTRILGFVFIAGGVLVLCLTVPPIALVGTGIFYWMDQARRGRW